MGASGADGSGHVGERSRRRAMRRRVAVVAATVAVVLQLQSPAPAQVPAAYLARVCAALQGVQVAFPGSDVVRQALAPLLARFACGPAVSTTAAPGTTTTSVHLDCPLPGGGVGPCPTTTLTTLAPTTLPPGATTVPPPSTTLPPCPSTTMTSMPNTTVTTIPCQP